MSISIFSEEPEQDLWLNILQYSYKANIRKYFIEHNHAIIEDKEGNDNFDVVASAIAGALSQADEYYKSSRMASLHIEPLLLYYGTTNLLYAMSMLLTGKSVDITNHGMKIIVEKDLQFISDTKVRFMRQKDGGVHVFARSLGFNKDLCEYMQKGPEGADSWVLLDFLDSIAEICEDFKKCYNSRKSHVIMLHSVYTPDGRIEKIKANDVVDFYDIEDFSQAYLKPQFVKGLDREEYIILHHKINGSDIQHIAYSGQPYLQIGHRINDKLITIPEELNMYITLFILGNLCRYYPEKWYTFVSKDMTGERLLIEKLLYFSRRILPNIVLNNIENNTISFVSDKYVPEDRIHLVGDHEVKEIVQTEVNKQLKDMQLNNVVHVRR